MRHNDCTHRPSGRYSRTGTGAPCRPGINAVFLVLALLGLAGCAAVGPDYIPPTDATPAQWHSDMANGLDKRSPDPDSLAKWWELLGDPLLESLEHRAVEGNLDLRKAAARVREARALRGVSKAALFPTLDAGADASRSRTSSASSTGVITSLYSAGFDAGWELDIFGGRQRAVEASQAELEMSLADLYDVLVSLTAETGLAYVEIRTLQARLASARDSINSLATSHALNQSRYQAGLIDELAVKQSLYLLEHTRSQIPALKTSLAAAMNRLAVLLGRVPGSLDAEMAPVRPVPLPPDTVAVGVPADAMRRRPDIRSAERSLAAATAAVGIATAELYPKFSLFGSIGVESLTLSDLPHWASRIWGIGSGISWRLFDAGSVRRNIQATDARQERALIQYQGSVLAALEEVENALVAYAREQEQRDSLTRSFQAAFQAEQLARDRYKIGVVDFSEVLDAQRSRISFQDELVVSQGRVTEGVIRIYKALGGGWQSMVPPDPREEREESPPQAGP